MQRSTKQSDVKLKDELRLDSTDVATPDVCACNCGTDLWQHYITEQNELRSSLVESCLCMYSSRVGAVFMQLRFLCLLHHVVFTALRLHLLHLCLIMC
ncbi:hypothetical protein AVEN_19407-1 [Araneus ventricosus]|uniref:Uncharacterized protein n=1 Tax=Araneus ventricosus TaxID=182803 RepID=A0A4Y2C802_ARAVE|nr:hypothetical protein AVEN_19407-1 [Araneus ventricosus]